MRILHTYCLNYNIGDYALGIGLKNLLRKYLNVELIGNTNIQGREFNEYYIKEVVNKRYDLLVIGGGGIIHGAHWPNGWFWLIEKELIKKIEIPFIVYGAGVNYWPTEGDIPERTIKHLNETIKRATFFSVRNDGSYLRLIDKIKNNNHLINIVPDPGFHVNLTNDYKREIEDPFVIIQLANDKPSMRFGNNEGKNNFVKDLREVVKKLANRYKVIFAPHVYDDVELSYEVARNIDNTDVWNFGYFAFDKTLEAIGYYKYAEFVLSMRGHGQIIPIAFNTPVIALGNHPKHLGLMKELGLADYFINISDKEFVSKMFKKITRIEADYFALKNKYRLINSDLINTSANSFRIILERLNNAQ
jgi:polysaccharide pyruvyl transferase WcaK-like protein